MNFQGAASRQRRGRRRDRRRQSERRGATEGGRSRLCPPSRSAARRFENSEDRLGDICRRGGEPGDLGAVRLAESRPIAKNGGRRADAATMGRPGMRRAAMGAIG